MKTVFDKEIRESLINRINLLNDKSRAQLGKMNVYQMLRHCALSEELYLGKTTYKRRLVGRLLGGKALRNILKDERPLGRNAKTLSVFLVKETGGNIAEAKMKWISLIKEYEFFSKPEIVHWFFGKMNKEQVGSFAYKHIDHHLRQFNC